MGLALKKGEIFEQPVPANDRDEYSVYIFLRPDPEHNDRHHWEKIKTTSHRRLALQKAMRLHKSRKYEKVEVKRKFFDKTLGRCVGATCKVYKSSPALKIKYILFLLIPFIAAFSVLGGFLLF